MSVAACSTRLGGWGRAPHPHSLYREDRRFIGNSSPSPLTSTGSRSRADWR